MSITIQELESIATAKGITIGEALDEIVEMELGKRSGVAVSSGI